MIRILQSSWMAPLVGGLLYLSTTAVVLDPSQFAGVRAVAEEAKRPSGSGPSWEFRNPEFDQWLAEIKQEKELLAVRAQRLDELQARLEAERQEISLVTESVNRVQAEFDRNVVRFKEQETDNIKRQAKLFASMSPEGAAALINEMSDDDAVRLLFVMKNDEAGLVLDTLSKMGQNGIKRAATIAERLRRVLPPDPAPARSTTTP